MEKVCRTCGRAKPLSEFHRNKREEDGFQSFCKSCRHKYFKEWYSRPGVREKQLRRMAKWRNRPDVKKRTKEKDRQYTRELRLIVLRKISGVVNPYCSRCGCDDLRLLEVNHKNGGGCKEIRKKRWRKFYQDIKLGRRPTDDLNVLCRVCNARDYLERKYGEPLPYNIIWHPMD